MHVQQIQKIAPVCLTVLGIDLCNFLGALQPDASCINGYEKTHFWCKFAKFPFCLNSAHEHGSTQRLRSLSVPVFSLLFIQVIAEMFATNVHDIGIFFKM